MVDGGDNYSDDGNGGEETTVPCSNNTLSRLVQTLSTVQQKPIAQYPAPGRLPPKAVCMIHVDLHR